MKKNMCVERHICYTYSLRIRRNLKFPAIFWWEFSCFFDPVFEYFGKFTLSGIKRGAVAPITLQPIWQLSGESFIHTKGTWNKN